MTRADRLRHSSVAERVAALQEVAAGSAPTPDELDTVIEYLGEERKAIQRRAAEAAAQCARADPRVVERLHDVVTASAWRQRWGAVFALSLLGPVPRAALPTLLEALAHDDGDVRWAAADLVKQLASREASLVEEELLRAAREGKANQRKMSLYCLRDLRLRDGADVAAQGLHAQEIDVRLAALSAVVALSDDKAAAMKQVSSLLGDPDARMRRAAAAALGQLGVTSEEVSSLLNDAARAEDPALRRAALGALRALAARQPG